MFVLFEKMPKSFNSSDKYQISCYRLYCCKQIAQVCWKGAGGYATSL